MQSKYETTLCISETWLNAIISDNELNSEDYTIYRKDRISEGRSNNGEFQFQPTISLAPVKSKMKLMEV